MTPEERAAFIIAQSVSMYAEIEGMKALNKERERNGFALAYGEESFLNIANKYGLEHNQLCSFLQ